MNRPLRRCTPQLDRLEGKQLLSALAMGPQVQSAAEVLRLAAKKLSLSGTIRGRIPPISASVLTFAGKGNAGGMGSVTLRGQINAANLIGAGTVSGGALDVTLSNRKGSVLLRIEPSGTLNLLQPPYKFRYTIQSGTGKYVGAIGAGTARLGLPGGIMSALTGGKYVLTLKSGKV